MESNLFYVRIDRNVRGPFTRDALGSMFARGRLRSDSQVSSDRNTWVALRTLGDPFIDGSVSGPSQDGHEAGARSFGVEQYFCSIDGETLGPMPIEALQRLVVAGRLAENDQIWQEGSPDWIAARALPGLKFSSQSRRAVIWAQDNPAVAASVAFMLIALFGLPTYYVVAGASSRKAERVARENERISRETEEQNSREREQRFIREKQQYADQIQDLRMQYEVERARAESNDRDKEATERRYKAQLEILRDQLESLKSKESAASDSQN
jgi:hypothetical protein